MINLQSKEFGYVSGQHVCVSQCCFKEDNAEGSYDGHKTVAGLRHLLIIQLQLLLVF
jgi:hypothetical protein